MKKCIILINLLLMGTSLYAMQAIEKYHGTKYDISKLAPHVLTFDTQKCPKINNYLIRLNNNPQRPQSICNYPVCKGILAKFVTLETQEDETIKISFLKNNSVYWKYLINPNYVTVTMDEQFLIATKVN